jgi:hypothetical protein
LIIIAKINTSPGSKPSDIVAGMPPAKIFFVLKSLLFCDEPLGMVLLIST